MLTISQLAGVAGVTVRAVRHYHQRGLLAEPRRDSSGYRRYDGQAVIDLLKIATLAHAGVPLAQVETLLTASPEAFSGALTQLDTDLEQRISRLQQDRQCIMALRSGDRLVLPGVVVDYLDRLRTLGVSETTVAAERDGWTVLQALAPDQVLLTIEEKSAALDDPDFQRIYLAFDEAARWDPDDPRLPQLADMMISFMQRRQPDPHRATEIHGGANYRIVQAILTSLPNSNTPAWERLTELAQSRLAVAEG